MLNMLVTIAVICLPAGTFFAYKVFGNYWKQLETDPVKLNEAERNTAERNAGDQFVNFNDVVETFACHLPQGSRLRFENSQFYIEDKYGAPLKPTSSRALKPIEQMAISHDNLVSISKIVYDIVPIGDPNAYSKDERLAELGIPLPKGFNPQKEPTQFIKFDEPDMQVKANENYATLKNEAKQVKASAKYFSDMVGMNSSEFAEASKSLQDVMLRVVGEKTDTSSLHDNRALAELQSDKVVVSNSDDSVYFYKQKEEHVNITIRNKIKSVECSLTQLGEKFYSIDQDRPSFTGGYFVRHLNLFIHELLELTLLVSELEQELIEYGFMGYVHPDNLMFFNNTCNEISRFMSSFERYRNSAIEINDFVYAHAFATTATYADEDKIKRILRHFRITFENLIHSNKA